jgi:hypothetical protein
VQDGAWLALAGSALMATGGLLASHGLAPQPEQHVAAPPAGRPSWAGHSVAPPPH